MKIINLLKQNIYLLLLVFLLLFVSFRMPQTYWAFVDDGEMIEVSQRMNSSLDVLASGQVFEWIRDPQMGRFRPIYWLFHYIAYVLFGLNRFGHGVMQLFLLWTTTFMCYLTAKKVSSSKLAGFLSGIFFVTNTLSQENWYRLGPQEAPMIFFFSVAVYFFISFIFENISAHQSIATFKKMDVFKKLVFSTFNFRRVFIFKSRKEAFFYWFTFVFTFFGYFTKENSLAFLVFPLFLYIWILLIDDKKIESFRLNALCYLIFNFLMVVLTRYGAMRNYVQNSYASDYIFNLTSIWSNFTYYTGNIWNVFSPVLIVIIIYMVTRYVSFVTDRKLSTRVALGGIILITFLSFFVIQLPWRYAVDRYLLPSFYFFALFVGLVLSKVLHTIQDTKRNVFLKMTGLDSFGKQLSWFLWFLITTVVLYNMTMITQYISRIYRLTNNFNKPLIVELSKTVGTNGRVIMDTPPGTALELKQEIGLHLHLFFKRPDIGVFYFENAGKLYPNDVLLRAGELRQVSKDSDISKSSLATQKRIDIRVENKVYYYPMAFLIDYLPKLIISGFQGRTFSLNLVLASNTDEYYWEIYDIN